MQQLGVSKQKLQQKSQTTKFAEKELRLVQVLNGMLGFHPTSKAIFKLDGKEIELNAIFDSQDWNPNDEKCAVFEFSTKFEAKADAE